MVADSPISLEGYFNDCSPRGQAFSASVQPLCGTTLRTGISIMFLSLIAMIVTHVLNGNVGIFSFEVHTYYSSTKGSVLYFGLQSLFMLLYLSGLILVAIYQAFLPDNSKFTRGFRAGSKILTGALILGILAASLRFVNYIYAVSHLQTRWWARFSQSKGDWIVSQFATFVDAGCNFFLGLAFLLLDVFHDEGTYQVNMVWRVFTLFALTAGFEILYCLTNQGNFYTIFLVIALSHALSWSGNFEKVVELSAPTLHTRDLTTNIAPKSLSNYYGD